MRITSFVAVAALGGLLLNACDKKQSGDDKAPAPALAVTEVAASQFQTDPENPGLAVKKAFIVQSLDYPNGYLTVHATNETAELMCPSIVRIQQGDAAPTPLGRVIAITEGSSSFWGGCLKPGQIGFYSEILSKPWNDQSQGRLQISLISRSAPYEKEFSDAIKYLSVGGTKVSGQDLNFSVSAIEGESAMVIHASSYIAVRSPGDDIVLLAPVSMKGQPAGDGTLVEAGKPADFTISLPSHFALDAGYSIQPVVFTP